MADSVNMKDITVGKKIVAIVMFGPETVTSGFRPAEYYQVTIDPKLVSTSGRYIRFGLNDGDEIHGWQRVEAMTICEVLADWPADGKPEIKMTEGPIVMRALEDINDNDAAISSASKS